MNKLNPDSLDWEKMNGLVPATIQDAATGRVLMIGYMNPEALEQTIRDRRVTFWSRSKEALWTKGETSGHYLDVVECFTDCDNDALLILANPRGPTCHLGTDSCFGAARSAVAFLGELDKVIADRKDNPPPDSYTASLFESGVHRIAQKVGEEGVEVALAAVTKSDEELVGEAGDLLYHLLVLLHARNLSLADVSALLETRHG